MSRIDSSDIVEKWRSGTDLSFAWFKFADPYAVAKYRECPSRGGQDSHQLLMVADLWARLSTGELQAFGKCIAPDISDGPVPIPPHTFDFGPPRDVELGDEIDVAGWHYQFVKVIRIRGADTEEGAELPTETEWSPDIVADEVEKGLPVPPMKKNRVGRRDTYLYLESVLEVLRPASSDPKVSAEQLHPDFYVEFLHQYPRDKYKIAVPTVRTLRKKLLKFRKEPETIGNN